MENNLKFADAVDQKMGDQIRKVAAWAHCSFAIAAACYTANAGNLMKAAAAAKKARA